MKKKNSVDKLVDDLVSEFSKIKNFELTQNDPIGNKLFTFIVKNASELIAFKNLFIQYYLPASLKSSQNFTKELKFSKYKDLIKLDEDDLKENYYETIRLGYVGAYHKYESYMKKIELLIDDFFQNLFQEEKYVPINIYLKSTFNIDLKKTTNKFYASEKINWIANCVKHYDGFPIKEPILKWFKYSDKSKKIKIESKEFNEDLDSLSKQNQLILTVFFLVGFYQYMELDFDIIKDQLSQGKEEKDVIELKIQIKHAIVTAFK